MAFCLLLKNLKNLCHISDPLRVPNLSWKGMEWEDSAWVIRHTKGILGAGPHAEFQFNLFTALLSTRADTQSPCRLPRERRGSQCLPHENLSAPTPPWEFPKASRSLEPAVSATSRMHAQLCVCVWGGQTQGRAASPFNPRTLQCHLLWL